MQILIATTNRGKIEELRAILGAFSGLELVTPADLGLALEVAETGASYAENAAIKANAFSAASGMTCLADDSGLEVAALGGEPGLYSARYCNTGDATDADRRRYLLEKLASHPRPWIARFVCVVALARPGAEVRFAEGTCTGEIIPEERGGNGFGYDPVFLIPEKGCTMAELAAEEKNRISHRARALQAAGAFLKQP